ncbi:MAG TPA: hypothetical protein VFY29_01420, partial [Terriglobia bacterium]|nr:hypothetical protein [Terriglobia bacterium]
MTPERLADWGRNLCLGCALLGVLGLVGWLAELTVFVRLLPGGPPMMPNTALALLLAGVAGGLRRHDDAKERRLLGIAAALAVFLIGAATLIEYVFAIDLRIDQALIQTGAGPFPGRPSPPTALALMFFSAGIVVFNSRPDS